MSRVWLADERAATATGHILDAAGRCFAANGVRGTSIADIARAAGCSRPTVYRYFADRDALVTAFVHRAARTLAAEALAAVGSIDDPGEVLVTAVLAVVDGVRADPMLAAWFGEGAAGDAGEAASSLVIESLATAFLGDPADDDVRARARWLVRITLSLLAAPGRDADDERRQLERFVVPVVVR